MFVNEISTEYFFSRDDGSCHEEYTTSQEVCALRTKLFLSIENAGLEHQT